MLPPYFNGNLTLNQTRMKEAGDSAIPDVDHSRYFNGVLGPLIFGLSIGLQFTMTGFMVIGPIGDQRISDQLTHYGRFSCHPKHDLHVWVIGILLTLILILAAVQFWRMKLRRVERCRLAGFMTYSALLYLVLGVFSLVVYLLLLASRYASTSQNSLREPHDQFATIILFLPALMAIICVIWDMNYAYRHAVNFSARFNRWRRRLNRTILYATPALLVLILYVPRVHWTRLAGQSFLGDYSCHHITHYIMAPALSFVHGRAFETEFNSLYGIGWPLVFSSLSSFFAMTYGNLFGLLIICGCIYYLGLFFLLRASFRSEIWAVIATVLALYWQMYSPLPGLSSIEFMVWVQPSKTMIRHWWDVWFFFALLKYQRSGRILWAAFAGLFCGFGILFETDTGIYLLTTFVFFWLLQAGLALKEGRPLGIKGYLLPPLLFCTATIVATLPIMFYASRGTLFTPAFWRCWLEPIWYFSALNWGGRLMAALPDDSIILFLAMTLVYLSVVSYTLIKALHRQASQCDILLASVSAYGLMLMIIFIRGANSGLLYNVSIPFAVMLTVLLFQCRRALQGWLRRSSVPWILAGSLIVFLLSSPVFLCYPSLLKSLFIAPPHDGLTLLSNPIDISGIPLEYEGYVRETQDVIAAIKTIAPDGRNVAIFDYNDSFLYYCANVQPWSRYPLLLWSACTKHQLQDIEVDLMTRHPKYVVIRGRYFQQVRDLEEIWQTLYQIVANRYALERSVGPYEFWRYSYNSDAAVPAPAGLPFTIQKPAVQ